MSRHQGLRGSALGWLVLLVGVLLTGVAVTGCGREAEETGQGGGGGALAEPATAKTTKPAASDPAATTAKPTPDELLRRVADFYKSAKTVQVQAETTMEMHMGGLDQKITSSTALVYQRPNRFAIRSQGGMMGGDIICDGSKLITYLPTLNTYTEAEAPGSVDALKGNAALSGAALGGRFVIELLTDDPYASLMEGVTASSYVGLEQLDGKSVHRVRFEQKQADWELFVDAGDRPVVYQVLMDMAKSIARAAKSGAAMFQGKDAKMMVTQRFRDWKFDEELGSERFVFEPPAGAKKASDFRSALGGLAGGRPAPSPLLGKPAPTVDLQLLDGGDLRLADHAGKHLVVLDFWATWCPPCRREMPVLQRVAKQYADKGVAFYAVNQGEEAERIQKFVDETELELTVALDSDKKMGNAYQVQAIPTLVVIDKGGVVQAVHTGFRPDIEKRLAAELDALLAGKSLAGQGAEQKPAATQQTEPAKPTTKTNQPSER